MTVLATGESVIRSRPSKPTPILKRKGTPLLGRGSVGIALRLLDIPIATAERVRVLLKEAVRVGEVIVPSPSAITGLTTPSKREQSQTTDVIKVRPVGGFALRVQSVLSPDIETEIRSRVPLFGDPVSCGETAISLARVRGSKGRLAGQGIRPPTATVTNLTTESPGRGRQRNRSLPTETEGPSSPRFSKVPILNPLPGLRSRQSVVTMKADTRILPTVINRSTRSTLIGRNLELTSIVLNPARRTLVGTSSEIDVVSSEAGVDTTAPLTRKPADTRTLPGLTAPGIGNVPGTAVPGRPTIPATVDTGPEPCLLRVKELTGRVRATVSRDGNTTIRC